MKYANGEFIQVHPRRAARRRQVATDEPARGEGRVWVPHCKAAAARPAFRGRALLLPRRCPTYGNLVPRDIATREIFSVCTKEGLSVEGPALRLPRPHPPAARNTRPAPGGILEIYEKFQGVDPRDVPMKIFPAVHYSMGGLWADYERSADGGLVIGSPATTSPTSPASTPSASATIHVPRRQRLEKALTAQLYLRRVGCPAPGIAEHC
ncbi:MAG: FAD-binding protein [Pirellulales bacterium]